MKNFVIAEKDPNFASRYFQIVEVICTNKKHDNGLKYVTNKYINTTSTFKVRLCVYC